MFAKTSATESAAYAPRKFAYVNCSNISSKPNSAIADPAIADVCEQIIATT